MTDNKDGGAALLDSLRRFVAKKLFEELEAAWLVALEDGGITNDDLFAVLQALARRNEPERTGNLFWYLLSDRVERNGAAEALGLAKRAAGLAPAKPNEAFLPDSETLRKEIASLYRAMCADAAETETLVEMTVLRPDLPLAKGVEQTEKLLALRPGGCVLDRKAAGRITGVDPKRKLLAVEFADGERTYDGISLDQLTLLERDDFRARAAFEPGGLKALAQDDPAGLVTLVLRAFGPFLTFRGLKAHLAPVLSGSAWSRWWTAARPVLKRAPLVQMSDEAQPSFGLRVKPVAYDDDVRAQFLAAGGAEDRLAVVLDYVRETGGENAAHPPNAELLGYFAGKLGATTDELRESDPMLAAAALAVLGEMHGLHTEAVPSGPASPEPLLFGNGDVVTLRAVQNDRLAQCALRFVRKAVPGRWRRVYAAVLPGSTQESCEWIARELCEAGFAVDVTAAVPAIFARPDQNANALIWLWKSRRERFPDALGSVDGTAVAARLLAAAEALAKRASSKHPEHKQMLTAVVRALAAKDHELFRAALDGARADQLRLIRSAVERNIGLTDHARAQLVDAIRRAHPAMFEKSVEPWADDVIYTTEGGLRRRQQELYDLVNVKLAEASKAVGEAAADGDLAENFAWTAALADRDRLASMATRMQAEINKARLITPELCRSDEQVTVGSAARARNRDTGQEKTFVFLGPWDADHDKGIYSYSAALGLEFMGKKKGEVATHSTDGEEETWEIVEIRSGV